MSLHEALEEISWLSGRWATTDGQGSYPTIEPFKYHETLEFVCIGQPMFNYISTSSHPDKKNVMHQERGFFRVKPETNHISFLVSHNFGITSVEEGNYDPKTKEMLLKSTSISRMSFSKPPHVISLHRKLKLLSEDTLEMIIYMETECTKLTQHLYAVYKRQPT